MTLARRLFRQRCARRGWIGVSADDARPEAQVGGQPGPVGVQDLHLGLPGRDLRNDVALVGDQTSSAHHSAGDPGAHPEERGVHEQVVQRDLIQPAARPGVVLGLDGLADLADGGTWRSRLGRRARQPGSPRYRVRTTRVRTRRSPSSPARGSGDMLAEQPRGECGHGAAQPGPVQGHSPGGGLDRHRAVAVK